MTGHFEFGILDFGFNGTKSGSEAMSTVIRKKRFVLGKLLAVSDRWKK